jgi:hypothetical protein
MQTKPELYSKGMVNAAVNIIAKEGLPALFVGFGKALCSALLSHTHICLFLAYLLGIYMCVFVLFDT